jgi:hypothetical protein
MVPARNLSSGTSIREKVWQHGKWNRKKFYDWIADIQTEESSCL